MKPDFGGAADHRARQHPFTMPMLRHGFFLNLCCECAYTCNIRARRSSGPARPYIARFRVLRRLICPSV